MQDILYPRGVINVGLQFVSLIWGLYASRGFWMSKNPIIKSTSILLFMYIIYGVFYLMFPEGYRDFNGIEISHYKYLQISLNSLLPIVACYAYSIKGYLSEKRILIYSLIFLGVFIILFINNQQNLVARAIEAGSDREEFTNNIAYEFLTLLPLACFFYKKPLWQYLYVVVTILFIVMGMKRGAILIATFCLVYFIINNSKSFKSKFARKWTVALSLLLVIGIIYVISYLIENSYYFIHRLEETRMGDSSGRDILYMAIWNGIINDDSIFHLLFGRGAYSTISFSGHLAHQDWLEILCCNGIIGVLILCSFFVSLFKSINDSRKSMDNFLSVCFVMTFIICLSRTFFSMSIQNFELSQSMLLGYLAAQYYSCKK